MTYFITITDHMMKALYLTLFIELSIILLLKVRNLKFIMIAILVNIITNLSMNMLLNRIENHHDDWILFGFEITIILVEAMIYYLILKDFRKAFIISLVCNLSSYLLGLILIPFIY